MPLFGAIVREEQIWIASRYISQDSNNGVKQQWYRLKLRFYTIPSFTRLNSHVGLGYTLIAPLTPAPRGLYARSSCADDAQRLREPFQIFYENFSVRLLTTQLKYVTL